MPVLRSSPATEDGGEGWGEVRGTFYACNDEAIYKAHVGLNIKGLWIIVFYR